MKIDNYLTIRDFFNYYISGLIWILIIIVLQAKFISDQIFANIPDFLYFQIVLPILISILFPYLVGYLMTPLSELITCALRKIFGDPKKIMVHDNSYDKSWYRFVWKKRLSKSVLGTTFIETERIFQTEFIQGDSKVNNWFEVLFSYVLEKGESLSIRVNRTRNLMNFSESIIISLPLFAFLTLTYYSNLPYFVSVLVSVFVFILISYRYLIFRKNLTMQVYRAFVVLSSNIK